MKKLLLILLFGFSTLFAFEDITADNFDQKVKNKNVIVDFYYTW
jgi:thioredoxin 1